MQGSLPSFPELFCNEGENVIKLLTTQEIIPIVWLSRATKKVGKQKKKKEKKKKADLQQGGMGEIDLRNKIGSLDV